VSAFLLLPACWSDSQKENQVATNWCVLGVTGDNLSRAVTWQHVDPIRSTVGLLVGVEVVRAGGEATGSEGGGATNKGKQQRNLSFPRLHSRHMGFCAVRPSSPQE
jgi:hypothetical protein